MKQNIKARFFSLAVVFCIIIQTLAPIGFIRVKASEQETVIDVSKGVFEINTDTKQYKQGGDWIDIEGKLVISGITNTPFGYKVVGNNFEVIYRDLNAPIGIEGAALTGFIKINFESNNYRCGNPFYTTKAENWTGVTGVSIEGIHGASVDSIYASRGLSPAPLANIDITVKNINVLGHLHITEYLNPILENVNLTAPNIEKTEISLHVKPTKNEDTAYIKNSRFGAFYMVVQGKIKIENVTNYELRGIGVSSSHINGNAPGNDNFLEIKDSDLYLKTISAKKMEIINSRVQLANGMHTVNNTSEIRIKGSTIRTSLDNTGVPSGSEYDFLTSAISSIILEDSSLELKSTNWNVNRFYMFSARWKHDPIDSVSNLLLLNKIQIPNNINKQVSVSIDGRTPVNLWTNEEGFLHLYLTTGNHIVKVTDLEGREYSLEFEGSSERESSLTSNIIGSVIPTSEDIIFDLSPNYNSEIEYSFDRVNWNIGTTDSEGKIVISVPRETKNVFFRINGEIYASDGQSPVTKYAPIILGQSLNTLVQENGSTALFVLAKPYESSNSLTYQWYKNGEILSGKTKSTLNISSMQKEDEGTYSCIITESNGMSSNSNPIVVMIGSVGAGVDEELLEDLHNQISTLEGQLSQANTDKEILQNTISGLNNQVTALSETITSLNSQITALQRHNDELEEENEELLQQIAELIQQLSDANIQITALQSQIGILTAEKEGLSNQILTLESTITNLNSQITSLNLLLQEKEEENSDLKDTIISLNQQIQNLTEQINTYLLDISNLEVQNSLLTEQITNLTSQNQDLLLQLSILQEQLSVANIKIAGLEEKIIEFTVKQAELEGEKLTLEESNQTLQEQVTNLTNQNNQLQTKVTKLQEELDNANSQIEDLQEEVATLELRIAELEGLLTTANSEKDSLSQQVQEHLQTIIQLNTQINNLEELVSLLLTETGDNEEIIKNLNIQITNLNNQVFNLQEEINLLKNAKADLETQVSDLQLQITNLTNTILTLTNRVTELEGINSSLLDSLVEANNQVTSLEASISGLNERIVELEGNTYLLTNELVNAQNRLLAVNTLLDLIKDELGVEDEADILPEIIRLKSRLQEEINKNTNLQETIDVAIADLEATNEANRKLQEKLEELEELLANSDNEELLKKLLELQEELSASKNRVLELEGEKILLQEQLNNSIQQVELLKEKVDELNAIIKGNEKEFQDKLSELEKELDKLKEDNNSLEKSIFALEEESGRIILENDALQTEISRLQNLLDLANDTIDELREKILGIMLENERLKKELEKQSNVYPTNPNNDEVIHQLQKEIDALKEELNSKKKLPQNPNEAIVIIEKEQNVITTIIQNDLDQIKKDDKIKAKAGWEVAATLDSHWKRDLDISEVIKSTDSTESSFFAREIDKPDKIYYITVHVLTRKDIPSLTMPKTVYMGSTYKLLLGNVQNGKITFTSDNIDIAMVDDKGVVTPVSVGKVRITSEVLVDKDLYRFEAMIHVKDGGVTLNLRDGIVQAVGETPIITMYKLIRKNESVQLNVKGSNEATVKYITSNADIVTIKENGVMTGHNKGEATVTALIMQDSRVYTYLIKVRIDDGTEDSSKWSYLER